MRVSWREREGGSRRRRPAPARIAGMVLGMVGILAGHGAAEEPGSEPLLDELNRLLKGKPFSVGALFQTVSEVQFDRNPPGGNGFSIANLRLKLYGELDLGFGYFFQANFVDSPAILDARVYYKLTQQLAVDAGRFKAPFSRELLTDAGSIDFVNRSRVVSALAPGRQIGVGLRGEARGGQLAGAAGVFNGNGLDANFNDNDSLLYVGRIGVSPRRLRGPAPSDRLDFAINAGYSRDQNATLGGFLSGFRGRRVLVGADVRWTRGRLLAAGDLIAARLRPDTGPDLDPFGWHATLGFKPTGKSQLLIRWDRFSSGGAAGRSDQLILGYNLWPSRATEVQLNYVIPASGREDPHQLLFNAQLSF